MKSSPWKSQVAEIVETAVNAGVDPNEVAAELSRLADMIAEPPEGDEEDDLDADDS